MPYFWLGMLLVTLFATTLGWLPTSGISTPGGPGGVAGIVDLLRHAALPIATIALGLTGQYAILLRSSVAEALREGYVLTARAKGLRDDRILRGHILPNALLPTVTLAALNAGYVIGGALTVEIVFSWPGLGLLTQEALQSRDYPVLQGIFLLLAISVVVANLLADLLYSRLDPRVRHGAAR
jgi:peptide/nickel transport system permease protein